MDPENEEKVGEDEEIKEEDNNFHEDYDCTSNTDNLNTTEQDGGSDTPDRRRGRKKTCR